MKRLLLVAVIAAFACSTAADSSTQGTVQQAGSAEAKAAVQRTIDSTNRTYEVALVASDFARIAGFYAEDAIVLPPNEPAVRGRAAIEKWNASSKEVVTAAKLNTTELTMAGDYAIEVGRTEITAGAKGAKPTMRAGKYLTIWQKQPDGSWKIARDMFSPDK